MRYDQAYVSVRVNEIFCGSTSMPSTNPATCLHECLELLDQVCDASADSEFSPLTDMEKAQKIIVEYYAVADSFLRAGCTALVEDLYLGMWDRFGQEQLNARHWVYRAAIAMKLTYFYLGQGNLTGIDKGAAMRWALCTQADDILGRHREGGAQGRNFLRANLGMTSNELCEFNQLAAENLNLVETQYSGDWSKPCGFVEDVIRRLAIERPECSRLFTEPSTIPEFPLSQPYLSALLGDVEVRRQKGEEKAKGDALEALASYLFLLIPGWVPRRNVYEQYGSFETDILVRNLSQVGNLTAELLGRHFLVECKNWANPVGAPEVGYFLYRMHLTHSKFGVMFAKTDITGNTEQETAARGLIRKAFQEDDSICVVVTSKDVADLGDSQSSFWQFLLERVERVRFGSPRQASKGTQAAGTA